jgi:hypothetical protein
MALCSLIVFMETFWWIPDATAMVARCGRQDWQQAGCHSWIWLSFWMRSPMFYSPVNRRLAKVPLNNPGNVISRCARNIHTLWLWTRVDRLRTSSKSYYDKFIYFTDRKIDS